MRPRVPKPTHQYGSKVRVFLHNGKMFDAQLARIENGIVHFSNHPSIHAKSIRTMQERK